MGNLCGGTCEVVVADQIGAFEMPCAQLRLMEKLGKKKEVILGFVACIEQKAPNSEVIIIVGILGNRSYAFHYWVSQKQRL